MNEEIKSLIMSVKDMDMPAMHDWLVDIGEIPFKENLKALRAIEIRNDGENGRQSIERMMAGLEELIIEMESYRDASEELEKRTATVIH